MKTITQVDIYGGDRKSVFNSVGTKVVYDHSSAMPVGTYV